MRLAGREELNVVRGSRGSGSTMAADALKVQTKVLYFSPFVHHGLDTWIFILQCATTQVGEEEKWQDFSSHFCKPTKTALFQSKQLP